MVDTATAASVASGALRKVGAYPASKRAPNPHELAVAVEELDKLVSHLGGSMQLPWIRRTYLLPVVAGQATIDVWRQSLEPAVVTDPPVSIERWDAAHLIDPLTNRTPVKLLFEDEWLRRCADTRTGKPCLGWVEHVLEPVLHLWPTPDAGHDGWTLELVGDASTKVLTEDEGQVEIPMPPSWRRYLETELAVTLGKGPIRRLSNADLVPLERDAARFKSEIVGGSVPESRRLRIADPYPF